MPCKNNYSDSVDESVKVLGLLKEVGIISEDTKHKNTDIYKIDERTRLLCEYCYRSDFNSFSEELKKWWDDHKQGDIIRLEFRVHRLNRNSEKEVEKFKNDLSDYEKELLKEISWLYFL